MNRRGFLSSCLALAAAPSIVRADSLMRVVPRELEVLEYAEFEWKQVGLEIFVADDAVIAPSPLLQQIIATTIQSRAEEIKRHILQSNAALAAMRKHRAWA